MKFSNKQILALISIISITIISSYNLDSIVYVYETDTTITKNVFNGANLRCNKETKELNLFYFINTDENMKTVVSFVEKEFSGHIPLELFKNGLLFRFTPEQITSAVEELKEGRVVYTLKVKDIFPHENFPDSTVELHETKEADAESIRNCINTLINLKTQGTNSSTSNSNQTVSLNTNVSNESKTTNNSNQNSSEVKQTSSSTNTNNVNNSTSAPKDVKQVEENKSTTDTKAPTNSTNSDNTNKQSSDSKPVDTPKPTSDVNSQNPSNNVQQPLSSQNNTQTNIPSNTPTNTSTETKQQTTEAPKRKKIEKENLDSEKSNSKKSNTKKEDSKSKNLKSDKERNVELDEVDEKTVKVEKKSRK